jgi:site-specific DNA recombinase
MPIEKRVGIWIRVSTEDQAQGESPAHHEQRARYYAQARGWEVINVYHLEGVSGKAVSDHPETKRMLADIKRGHITGLIFSKLARLARNTRELLDFADLFRESNADLISLQESIDTSTPAGRLFYTMIAAMAQWEREEIAERVAASVPVRARLGKPLGGQPPFGYQWLDGKLVPEPSEAPVRRLLFELFLQERRKKAVARLLNEAGHRTRNGGLFSDTTVDRLIRDPIAKGTRRANYTKSTGDGKHWTVKPESEWVLTEVEAIVPEELWTQCNAILDVQKRQGTQPGRKPVHLFAGLVVCHCGQKMYVPSNTPKYTCQKCRNKIPVVDMEGIYESQLRGFLLSPTDLHRYVDEAEVTIREQESLLQAMVQESRKLEQETNRLFDLHRDGQIPTQGFGARYQPLQERADQLAEEVPRLEADIDFLKVNLLSSDHVLYEAKDLADRWPKLSGPERRQIVETITDQIVIGKDGVTINLCYLPVNPELMATKQRNFIDALPFYHQKLSASKPISSEYPSELNTISDHIRKRRLELGLYQRDVARIVGVDKATVFNWEAGTASPNLRAWPGVINFLGYDPRPSGALVGEKLRRYREGLGLSWVEAAQILGVDPATLSKWERQPDCRQNHISIPAIVRFVGVDCIPVVSNSPESARNARLLCGYTQRELAAVLGVTQQEISEWERGIRCISEDQRERILDLFRNGTHSL